MCKIMEHMVNSRLVWWYLEKNKLISSAQCGFRNHEAACITLRNFCQGLQGGLHSEAACCNFLWSGEGIWYHVELLYCQRFIRSRSTRQAPTFYCWLSAWSDNLERELMECTQNRTSKKLVYPKVASWLLLFSVWKLIQRAATARLV